MKKMIVISTLVGSSFAAKAKGGDSTAIYLNKAKTMQDQRRWKDAEQAFHKALAADPNNYDVHQAFVNYHLQLRNYAEARTLLDKMHQLKPTDTAALHQLADLSYNLKKYPDAIRYYNELNAVMPMASSYLKLGKAYLEQEDVGKANAALLNAVRLDPKDAETYYQLAMCQEETNNYKKAISYFEQAIALQPEKYIWIYELGTLYFSNNENEKAIAAYEKAAAAGQPRDMNFLNNLGFAQLGTKDYEKGIATLNEVLVKKPGDVEVLYAMAQAHYQHGKFDKAMQLWEKVIAEDDTNFRAMYMMGMCYQRNGNITKGREICDRAIAGDPSLSKMKQEKFSF